MASTLSGIAGMLITFGFMGLIGFGILWAINAKKLADHKKWIGHGRMSIEKRMAELKEMDGVAYVARNCHYKLQEQRSVYNASTKSSHKEAAILYGIYRALVEVDRERIIGWRTQSFQDFGGFKAKWPLDKIECVQSFEIPMASATRLEIAGYSESDHRATSDSFYIYMVVDGATHIFAQDTTMKDVRELREQLQKYIDEFKGTTRAKPSSTIDGDGVPD